MAFGLARSTKFAVQNASRNLWLSIITIFLLVLTTISITLVGGLNVVGNQLLSAIESKVDVDVYFFDYVKEEEILDAQEYMLAMPEVSSVVYVSRDEALEKYIEAHQNDEETLAALEEIGTNPLPASVIIRTHDIDDYETVITNFEQSEFGELVDQADYGESQQVIGRLSSISKRASQIGITVSIVFVVISIIVIFNTLRIAIYNHRGEIGIMKLVGATNWFIRSPFIIEGILMGLVASALTIGITYAALYFSDGALTTFFAGYDFSLIRYFSNNLLEFVLLEVVGTILLSTGSTMVAISRHLKV